MYAFSEKTTRSLLNFVGYILTKNVDRLSRQIMYACMQIDYLKNISKLKEKAHEFISDLGLENLSFYIEIYHVQAY